VNRSLRLYIASVSLTFWGGLLLAYLTGNVHAVSHPRAVAPLFGIAVAAEALVVYRRKETGKDTFSFSATAHIAIAILFGPVVAAIVAATAVVVVDGLRMVERDVILMNSSLFGLSAWLSGWAFVLAGGTVGRLAVEDALPLVVLIGVRVLVNEVVLSGAVALSRQQHFATVLRDGLRGSLGASLGEGSLGVLIAFGYDGERWVVLPFLVPLLAALYQSQLNFERLRTETNDALNAFAAVIDERDPSTAEHSSRVAQLVERFTVALELPDQESDRLVAAARFHDLGKVAVDVATLSKEGRLDAEELRAIRSHPRLSAQLLSPFGFAQEMALYAELHHERYDGAGYYSVSQRDIPVEAHVLIVADSFDAMTSKRAYRPALTAEEAVHELRDKAGTQFHPMVAQAFAAMIEGHDIESVVGVSQANALRSEFSRIPLVHLSRWKGFLQEELRLIYLAGATLVAVGIPGVPWQVVAGLGAATLTTMLLRVVAGFRRARMRNRVLTSVAAGRAISEVLREAGIARWAVWVTWQPQEREYAVSPIGSGGGLEAHELSEIARRAMRPGGSGLAGSLASGVHLTMTAPDTARPRLAVGSDQRLSPYQCQLIDEVRALAVGAESGSAPAGVLHVVPDAARAQPASQSAVVLIELAAFENVRLVAGQLSAERVVQDAVSRLRRVLRSDDQLLQLGEDRLAMIIGVAGGDGLRAVVGRVEELLADVPVPLRADSINARVRSSLPPFAGDPELRKIAAGAGLIDLDERAAS